MSCKGCETEVNNELHKVAGVIDAQTFYDKGNKLYKIFDPTVSIPQQEHWC